MITDALLDHRWITPAVLAAYSILGPPVAAALAHRPRLAWWGTSVVTVPVLLATLIPGEQRSGGCAVQWSVPTPDRVESMANVVLFVGPVLFLGTAVRRPLLALMLASALSIVIETVQAAVPAIGRSCDTNDWVANSIGAAVGAALAWLACQLAHSKRPVRDGPPSG